MATIDGHNGITPLVLERAAELAIQKARDTAVALVRITHLGGLGSAAAVVAAMALRPVAGLVLGPGRLWSAAVPSPAGLPIVFDSGLADIEPGPAPAPTPAGARAGRQRKSVRSSATRLSSPPLDGAGNWSGLLVSGDSWLVAAIALAELEPMSEFHDRVNEWIQALADRPGRLTPAIWTDRHNEAHERGVAIAASVWKELKHWADRLAVVAPSPGRS